MLTGQDLTLATTFFESYQVRHPLRDKQVRLLAKYRVPCQDSFKRKKRRTTK